MKRRLQVTPRGWFLGGVGLVLAGLAFVFARYDALFAGVTVLAAVGGAALALWFTAKPGPMVRQLPEGAVPAGRPVTVMLRAVDGLPGPDPVVDATPWGPVAAAPLSAPGLLAYSVIPDRRGAHPLGPATVTAMAPMGLMAGVTTVAPATSLLVAPPLLDLDLPVPRQDPDRTTNAATPTAETVIDPSDVREYRPGDARRLVHWKATARRDTLMVREQVRRKVTDVWVVADTVASSADDAFETGLAVAATVADAMASAGHRVHLVTTGGQTAGFKATAGRDPIMEYFALAEPAGEEAPGWADGIGQALGPRGGQVPIYAVVAHPTPDRVAAMGVAVGWAGPGVVWAVGPEAAPLAQDLAAQGWLVEAIDEGAGV
ncbi:MAG: DUF58 domain-containing protein [Bifidobacteriaceae bacterium]|jgi:uncharacterized protein (DUF58 family)|nr:DUF58 domain-containing protein [Bifidobacteriaceae bacterium]